MRKYFVYEIKRNWLSALIITVFCCAIHFISIINANFDEQIYADYRYLPSSLVSTPIIMLGILCTLIPVLVFSFKMNARQVDSLYSMPLKREKIYLVKSSVGLLLTLVPYTAVYWLGFVLTILKPNGFELWGYVPLYFISIPIAILLFGINAFVFTRANRALDGIIFVALFTCAGALLAEYVTALISNFIQFDTSIVNCFVTFGSLMWTTSKYSSIISSSEFYVNAYGWLYYLAIAVAGIASWVGLFLTARKTKAENAEHISDSLFGYRVLIPLCLTFFTALLVNNDFVICVILVISAAVTYIIFRRSVKLKLEDGLALLGSVILGFILASLLSWTNYPLIY